MRTVALLLLACGLRGAEAPRPRILGVAHVAVFVSDVARARAFYTGYLGLAELPLERAAGAPERLAVVRINGRQFLELIAEAPKQDGNLSHIAFQTDDAAAMRAWLAARGIDVPGALRKSRAGYTGFQFRDPDGHIVEMVQYAAGARLEPMPEGRLFSRVGHIGILVRDSDRALAFYRGMLGFQPASGGKLRVPEGEDCLELGLNRKEPAPERLNIKNHVCFDSRDVAAAVSALRAKSGAYEIEVHKTSTGRQAANLRDPDGARIEIMEPNQ
ncbi:MAG: VOC family protein [Bryobacteraceae bacterium]